MERKFKVGDVIDNMFGEYTIVHLAKNGYKVTNNSTHSDGLIIYENEDQWALVSSPKEITLNFSVAKNIPCSQCN